VDFSNQMSSCSAITLIKQFSARTSTLSGLLDMLFSVSYDFVYNGIIYMTLVNHLQEFSTPCILVGSDIGNIISNIFSYKAPVEDRLK